MKKIAWLVLVLVATVARAQGIPGGTMWYDGGLVFTAKTIANNQVLLQATAEGEEIEFRLTPVRGKAGQYVVHNGTNTDAVNPYGEGMTARVVSKEGHDVISMYNKENQMVDALKKTTEWDAQKLNVAQWIQHLMGTYTMSDGLEVSIQWEQLSVAGMQVPYKVVTFNGMTIGLVRVEGTGTPMDGLWEVCPTMEGLRIYAVTEGDHPIMPKRTGQVYELRESNPNVSRFGFASVILLNGSLLRNYPKPVLRFMRNAIFAAHGQEFQSPELKLYFGNEPWYKPAPGGNSTVKLSFIESLNVELIKAEEARPDNERQVKE